MSEHFDDRSRGKSLTRRDVLRLAALSPLALAASAEAARPAIQGSARVLVPAQHEVTAGAWQTWLVPSVGALVPPAPPTRNSATGLAEGRELRTLQSQRSDAIRGLVQFWDAQGGISRWSQILLDKIKETRTNPVRAARAIALLHTAIADTTIAVWNAKFIFQRLPPVILDPSLVSLSQQDQSLPTYPSEHAAIGAAAATVLNYLFPGQTALLHGQRVSFDAAADEAGGSRLWAGANCRSDMTVGAGIGRSVAQLAVARGQGDGSGIVWDAKAQPGRLTGPQYWVPTPPGFVFPPLEVLASTWKPWLLSSAGQFRPGSPPALQGTFPSPQFLAETNEVYQTVKQITPEQRQIALFWADDPGTVTPPGHWMQVAAQQAAAAGLSTPRAARALALTGVGVADAAVACWECKFYYWVLRPITAIRTITGQPFSDPSFNSVITTPAFPSYSSGHSTFSGCAASVLSYLFPGGTMPDALGRPVSFNAAADQAALSRLLAGIHYRSDNDEGLTCGRQIADLVIHRAQADGAP